LAPENGADRTGDVRCGECGGSGLIEQWLEDMVVGAVDNEDVGIGAGKGAGGGEATEAGADDDDAGASGDVRFQHET
jgi:hypothetical protein